MRAILRTRDKTASFLSDYNPGLAIHSINKMYAYAVTLCITYADIPGPTTDLPIKIETTLCDHRKV